MIPEGAPYNVFKPSGTLFNVVTDFLVRFGNYPDGGRSSICGFGTSFLENTTYYERHRTSAGGLRAPGLNTILLDQRLSASTPAGVAKGITGSG